MVRMNDDEEEEEEEDEEEEEEGEDEEDEDEEMPHATIRHDQPPNNAAAPRDQRVAGAMKGKKVPRIAREASSIRAAVRNA